VVATGSQNNVRAAYSSGTPAIGVGAGNVVSIVDESADFQAAAEKIVISKSFDNATSCSSENNLIIVDAVYAQTMQALADAGAVLLNKEDQSRLEGVLWQEGKLNQDLIARDAAQIARLSGLRSAGVESARILLVEAVEAGPQYPFSGEKLSPILAVFRASDFAAAMETAALIMNYQGKGHSISIHTSLDDRVMKLGLSLPVCRVIVNQIHCFATGGNFNNGLPFSLSMGCGTWGRNSISDNLNYTHYLNTTRIVREITPKQPSLSDVFDEYWKAYDIPPLTE